jgi:hypothetical protein
MVSEHAAEKAEERSRVAVVELDEAGIVLACLQPEKKAVGLDVLQAAVRQLFALDESDLLVERDA